MLQKVEHHQSNLRKGRLHDNDSNMTASGCSRRVPPGSSTNYPTVHQCQPFIVPLKQSVDEMSSFISNNKITTVRPCIDRLSHLTSLLLLHNEFDSMVETSQHLDWLCSSTRRFRDQLLCIVRLQLAICDRFVHVSHFGIVVQSDGNLSYLIDQLSSLRMKHSNLLCENANFMKSALFYDDWLLSDLAEVVSDACVTHGHFDKAFLKLKALSGKYEKELLANKKKKETVSAKSLLLLWQVRFRLLAGPVLQGFEFSDDAPTATCIELLLHLRKMASSLVSFHLETYGGSSLSLNLKQRCDSFAVDAWRSVDLLMKTRYLLCFIFVFTGCFRESLVYTRELTIWSQTLFFPHWAIQSLILMAVLDSESNLHSHSFTRLNQIEYIRTSQDILMLGWDANDDEIITSADLSMEELNVNNNTSSPSFLKKQLPNQPLNKPLDFYRVCCRILPWFKNAYDCFELFSQEFSLDAFSCMADKSLEDKFSCLGLDDSLAATGDGTPERAIPIETPQAPRYVSPSVAPPVSKMSARKQLLHKSNKNKDMIDTAALSELSARLKKKEKQKVLNDPLSCLTMQAPVTAAPKKVSRPRRKAAMKSTYGSEVGAEDQKESAPTVEYVSFRAKRLIREQLASQRTDDARKLVTKSVCVADSQASVKIDWNSRRLKLHAAYQQLSWCPPSKIFKFVCQLLALCHLDTNEQWDCAFYLTRALHVSFGHLNLSYLRFKLLDKDVKELLNVVNTVSTAESGCSGLKFMLDSLPRDYCVLQLMCLETFTNDVSLLLATCFKSNGDAPVTLVLRDMISDSEWKSLRFENKASLNSTGMESAVWWRRRFDLERTLDSLMKRLSADWKRQAGDLLTGCEKVVLLLDRRLHDIPWEEILPDSISYSRMPSMSSLLGTLKLEAHETNLFNSYYLLNPDKNLPSTEQTFVPLFTELGWQGVSSRVPNEDEILSALCSRDMYVYCGHGCGSKYIKNNNLHIRQIRATALLIGCSSGGIHYEGSFEALGTIHSYLIGGSSSLVAVLWDVTDRDIDRFLEKFLTLWKEQPTKSINQLIKEARSACRLRHLIGSAPVHFGLPM